MPLAHQLYRSSSGGLHIRNAEVPQSDVRHGFASFLDAHTLKIVAPNGSESRLTFGAEVRMLEVKDRILGEIEADIAKQLGLILANEFPIVTQASILEITGQPDSMRIKYSDAFGKPAHPSSTLWARFSRISALYSFRNNDLAKSSIFACSDTIFS